MMTTIMELSEGSSLVIIWNMQFFAPILKLSMSLHFNVSYEVLQNMQKSNFFPVTILADFYWEEVYFWKVY